MLEILVCLGDTNPPIVGHCNTRCTARSELIAPVPPPRTPQSLSYHHGERLAWGGAVGQEHGGPRDEPKDLVKEIEPISM